MRKNVVIELTEKNIVHILNCMSFTLNLLYEHTDKEKLIISRYYDLNNYDEIYDDIRIFHRYLSLLGNSKIYNLSNEVFFEGQKTYMRNKNFDYLKEEISTVEKYEINEIKLPKNNIFKIPFKFIDKFKRIV